MQLKENNTPYSAFQNTQIAPLPPKKLVLSAKINK